MYQLIIPAMEEYDEVNEVFVYSKEQTLQLEHSLVSISKWEKKWHKPFLSNDKKTDDETLDYIRCMTKTQNVDLKIYNRITPQMIDGIVTYINDPMTATWFSEDTTGKDSNNEIITSEIIYYWMLTLQVPVEFQKWHLNSLLALIKVCNIKNSPTKKMSNKETLSRNKAINEARKRKWNTRG